MTTTERTTTTTSYQATVALKGSVAPPRAKAPSEPTTASAVGGGTGPSSKVAVGTGGGGGVSGFVLKLFSMINGAEDEVVSWTPAGDAFVIGSDIQRLESETLPKFFRHNRFQSLVRQLNFYSFRKINRERNVWIYKHDLFHRDRPGELHKVRRRTCPGVDGRKQRFSRLSVQRLNSPADGMSSNSSSSPTYSGGVAVGPDAVSHCGAEYEPTVSDDDGSMDELGDGAMEKDRYYSLSMPTSSIGGSAKKFGFATSGNYHLHIMTSPYEPIVTDTSISDAIETSHGASGNSLFVNDQLDSENAAGDEEVPDGVITGGGSDASERKKRRMEMMQQSLVVSEVALKLEEYVKKAMKERGITSRYRRGGSGIVTPPFGTTQRMTDLITYDDEYFYEEHDSTTDLDKTRNNTGRGPVRTISGPPRTVVSKDDDISPPPSTTEEDILRITENIVRKSSVGNEEFLRACANVAAFFMCTHPDERPEDCCEKILQLLSTSPLLQTDFYSYRMALHPDLQSANVGLVDNRALYLRKSLLGGTAGRLASLRDFKVFAVNLISGLLVEDVFEPDDRAILLRTNDAWSKSIEVGV